MKYTKSKIDRMMRNEWVSGCLCWLTNIRTAKDFSDYFVYEKQNNKRSRKKIIIEVFKLLIGTSTGCGWKREENKNSIDLTTTTSADKVHKEIISLVGLSYKRVRFTTDAFIIRSLTHTRTLTHTHEKIMWRERKQKKRASGTFLKNSDEGEGWEFSVIELRTRMT